MNNKNLAVLTLLFLSAAAAFSQTTLNSVASRAVGQPQLAPECGSPNRIEGRELWSPQNVALDTSGSSAIVYVSDLRNNRVLAWKNAAGFSNGAPADLVIGQPDLVSCNPQGPTGLYQTGLTGPTGIVIDAKGNLYVADAGNNRILRYPKPFNQQGAITPDMWIGQPSLGGHAANYTGQVSAVGISLGSGGNINQSAMAFDAAGNLWISDPGNARVLRFPAANIACTNCGAPNVAADIVIGQPALNIVQTPAISGPTIANQFGSVDSLAFDSSGRLYVTDQTSATQGRVLVFSSPSSAPANLTADRIMGIAPNAEIAAIKLQADQNAFIGATVIVNPGTVFLLPDNSVGVVDISLNRIMLFPPYETWPATSTHFSPQADAVFGQKDLLLTDTNANQFVTGGAPVTPAPSASTVWAPTSAAFLASTKELFVVDTGNNRVIVAPQVSGRNFGPATRVLGQDLMDQFSINLVEGKEFNFFASGTYADAGMALDTTTSVPHLWVSDTRNHRVLGFKDARKLSPSSVADIVIGQPDFRHAVCNYPTGDQNIPTQSSLCFPAGLVVDSQGNLYVADSGNHRVLQFPNPWASGATANEQAAVVLGQSSFTLSIRQPGNNTMSSPYGLAFSGHSGLVVSDLDYNRVVFIPFTNGTFTSADNGKAFSVIFGQSTPNGVAGGNGLNQLNAPHHVSSDTNGQVYVADTGNNRVLIFGDPNNPQTSSFANLALTGLTTPRGVYVNSGTGEIWVTNNSSLVRYPKYDSLGLNPAPTATIQDVVNNTLQLTMAVAQDQFGDLFVADSQNRIAVYYQGFSAVNAATSLVRPLAPGMIATLYPAASATQFVAPTTAAGAPPLPTTLADIQVTVNGTPAPLFFVSPGQINFFVPQGTQPNAFAEIEVIQVSTGQVLGAQQIPINTVAPGVFTTCQANQTGSTREACILNEDYTVNSATNPAPRGSVIQVFATGQGQLTNAPADGAPAAANPLAQSVSTPRVSMPCGYIDDCGPALPGDVGTSGSHSGQWVSFSGMAPGFAGLWQINCQIPMAVVPSTSSGGKTPIGIQLNGVFSPDTAAGFTLYFYVK